MDYYKKKQFIARVDKNDQIVEKIEKREAHKKGVLHRGFTVILIYHNQYILQHRKHPVFDGVFDLSFSSHPPCHPELVLQKIQDPELVKWVSGSRNINKMLNQVQHDKIGLQTMEEAIYDGIKREWNLEKKDLILKPKLVKKIYYKAKDPNSGYTEHEIDYIYKVELKKLPSPNFDFAYGFSLISKKDFLKSKVYGLTSKLFAPWVKVILKNLRKFYLVE